MPVVTGNHRNAALIEGDRGAALFALLAAIVATLAQRLPVATIPEKLAIAAMRDDVIHNLGRRLDAARCAHHAERMLTAPLSTGSLPTTGPIHGVGRIRPRSRGHGQRKGPREAARRVMLRSWKWNRQGLLNASSAEDA